MTEPEHPHPATVAAAPDDATLNSPLKIALQVVAGVAGLGAAVTVVGGVVLWLRFNELELAADQAVALLPKQMLVVAGAHALLGPAAVGAVAALTLTLVGSPARDRVSLGFNVALGVLVAFALGLVALLVRGYDWLPEQAVAYLAVIVATATIWTTARRSTLRRHIAEVVLIAFIACGAVLAVVRTSAAPKLEPVAVLLKGDKAISGFYVGQTSDRVYVAPLPGLGDPGDPFADAKIDRVVELPRDGVERIALRGPASVGPDGAGRQEAQTLLTDLRMQNAGVRQPAAEQVVTTRSPETAFAPLVHLDARETAYPMSVDAFLRNSWLMWAHDGCPHYSVALRANVRDPASHRQQIIGRFDRLRLAGRGAYKHAPTNARCKNANATFTAAEHTRPFDTDARPAALPKKEGFYLDLWDARRGGEKRIEREGAQHVLQKTPVYFERSSETHEGRRDLRITYWLFYGRSIPPGPPDLTKLVAHEGDWERVSVLLRNGPLPDQHIPTSVRYHDHEEHRDVPWDAVARVGIGGDLPTHPVAFSARGSHASYPRAGRYQSVLRLAGRRRLAVSDIATACAQCPQWRTWQMLADARRQPWYGFGGAWGKVGSVAGTTGPLGPSHFKLALGPGRGRDDAVDVRSAALTDKR